jgi:hypothetical protein
MYVHLTVGNSRAGYDQLGPLGPIKASISEDDPPSTDPSIFCTESFLKLPSGYLTQLWKMTNL